MKIKKSLVATLATALSLGTSAVTFAAASPFTDVPQDSWAYDAVTQLAQDGIINGYPDGTFRGQRNITRYEMAQMVAKAIAHEDEANAQDKETINKLAAEFSTELNNLGVRVSNLEQKTDNVKWTGEVRLQNYHTNYEREDASDDKTYGVQLRLKPQATVNDHWQIKAQLRGTVHLNTDSTTNVSLNRAYAEGHYGTATYTIGKQPLGSQTGMVFNTYLSGIGIALGGSAPFHGELYGGRINMNNQSMGSYNTSVASLALAEGVSPNHIAGNQLASGVANLFGFNAYWDVNKRFKLAGDYWHLNGGSFDTPLQIYGLTSNYNLTDTLVLNTGYWKSHGFLDNDRSSWRDANDHGYNLELDYKNALDFGDKKKGGFGIYTAYRYVGAGVSVTPTFNGAINGTKGWEIGGNYIFADNMIGELYYFRGKEIGGTSQDKVSTFGGTMYICF